MMVLPELNWLSIAAAFFAYTLLGALWFTVLFPKSYKRSLGRGAETLQNKTPIFLFGPPLCTLLITVTTAILLQLLRIHSQGAAACFALLAGSGYLAANTLMIAINPNIPHPLRYSLISGTYHLCGLLLACSLLTVLST